MTSFLDFLRDRLHGGGFTTEDALASILPLVRQTVAGHRQGKIAPLHGVNDLRVDGVRIGFAENLIADPVNNAGRVREIDVVQKTALEVTGLAKMTTDVDEAATSLIDLQIGMRGDEVRQPVYLPGYVGWEHEIRHHDPLTDIFSLGMILASLACNLDFTQPDDLATFVRHRRNLFQLNPGLHPVLAKVIVRTTELSRHRRAQDLGGVLHTLENYRDQDIDLDFDLARTRELAGADRKGKRELILSRLQQRLFEISKRNRLLHFRQTMHTVNLTWGSVPLSFDIQSIRPEHLLTWNADFAAAVVSGKAVSLNKYLRFEEAIYLPGLLDEIRNEARRDQADFGFAQLRLVLCFLRWSNLKEKPPERFDSPLVLLPVTLSKNKGVRDVYTLEAHGHEAEVNPVLRHYLKQLYNVDLPEAIDLTADSTLQAFFETLAGTIQASEPGITVEKIDRPRIQLIHAKARRRLDQYQRRTRLSGRGIRSFHDVDYSYDRDNFHPLGLRLFQLRIRTPESSLRPLVEDTPRPRTHAVPTDQPPGDEASTAGKGAVSEKERALYTKVEEESNPFHWEFDLCNVTLGNFRYRKMSLVRDYGAIVEQGTVHSGFDALFSLEPRAAMPAPPPTEVEDSYAIVSCDPTQASAIALARAGRDFIIQGPPGTGKSQTITNLIADYVVRGQRVLFVCEKRAAIDVVFHRLQQTGLHQISCLIHDSQADKKAFILDLKENYERLIEGKDSEWAADKRRQKLIAAFQQEFGPLRHFNSAMCQAPPQAGVPVRRLLYRALELAEHRSELSELDKEKLPPYALWEENRAVLDHLAKLLAESGRAAWGADMARVTRKTEIEPLDGSPEKRMYWSIINDYNNQTAITELIDNAIDLFLSDQHRRALLVDVDIDVARQSITITDNAGGVSRGDLRYLIAPGASKNLVDSETIGLFGVGGKRAVIALGEHVIVQTRHGTGASFQIDITKDWMESDDWEMPAYEIPPISQNTTRIECTKLNTEILDENIELLRLHFGETYTWFLDKEDCAIRVNGVPVKPVRFDRWAHPPKYLPRKAVFTVSPDRKSELRVEITAGLIRDRDPVAENYGVYFYCNNRLIIKEVRSRDVGYYVSAEAGVPHPDASLCRAIVRFNGPAKLMPWNSNKTAIQFTHPAFLRIRSTLLQLVSHFSKLSRATKRDWPKSVFAYSKGKVIEIEATDIEHGGRLNLPPLPPGPTH